MYQDAVFWMLTAYPKLKPFAAALGMIETIQAENDVVYVPPGWWHVVALG